MIYAMVNNRQAEHQSIVVESSGMLNHINVKILFDSGAIDSFISWMTLNKLRWLRGKTSGRT
jgi:hypothetical protein